MIDPVPQGGQSHGIPNERKLEIQILTQSSDKLIEGEDMLDPKAARHTTELGTQLRNHK